MRKIAYLTMADMGDVVTDFHLGVAPMKALGWQVEEVPWRSAVDWNHFDAVYICTPWDYPQHGQQFLDVLSKIEPSFYLRTDRGAAARFARALDQRFEIFAGK